MQFTRITAPDFDPYGDSASDDDNELWPAPTVSSPIKAVVQIPGSKSLTNRELILSALADEPSLLRAPLHSNDTTHMIEAIRSLGCTVTEVPARGGTGINLAIEPATELIGSTTIDCGLAGTVMRFIPPLAALALGPTVIDASPVARKRPMGALIRALRDLGVDIDDDARNALPFTVHGSGSVSGGEVSIDASASSQFVSALLLAGSRFENGVTVHHTGERLPSIPHIEMTIDVLARRGVVVERPNERSWVVQPGSIAGATVDIEPDLSNAAPFLAAAAATSGSVSVTGWPETTTQAGTQFLEVLEQFGAKVSRAGSRLTVTGPDTLVGVSCDLSGAGELVPTVTALAALASSPSTITGVGHIRFHETDRLSALATEINNLGGAVTINDDGLTIEPKPLHGSTWKTYNDHRMATTGAILGLRVEGILIEDIRTTRKTLPDFTKLWSEMIRSS